jgi:uncharacterized protein YoaH (UPF0181 family)
MIAVGSRAGPLSDDAEQRMTEFTDLVATAVANAQNRDLPEASRDELARLLAEQAALRRVATLVARGIDPGEVFSAVAEELRQLLGADHAGMGRFEQDGTSAVVVSSVGPDPVGLPVGSRLALRDYLAPAAMWRTGRPAPVEEDAWSGEPDSVADALRAAGIQSMVASPIIVEGRLWVRSRRGRRAGRFLPAPPTGCPTLPSSWPRRSVMRRAGPSWPPRGRGSSSPPTRPGSGSSGTCTTEPSSGWSR